VTVRIVHTGDIHLGQSLRRHARAPEHRRLLAWLRDVLIETRANALVIAGDLFHHANPSAAAFGTFFDFLGSLTGPALSALRDVVIVAGNHDGAARLDALRGVLSRIDVHVVGRLTADPVSWGGALVPLRDDAGDVAAGLIAIPFLSEYQLGIRAPGMNRGEVATAIQDGFTALYRRLTDRAAAAFPGLPLMATGHLAAMNEKYELGSSPLMVHMAIDQGLDGAIFDPRLRYVALGHIHKRYRVRGPANAWYCGSPLPVSFDEAEDGTVRGVLSVDLGEERPEPTVHPAPTFRQLLRWRGDLEEIADKLTALAWSPDELPPWLALTVTAERRELELEERLRAAVAARPETARPAILNLVPKILSEEPDAPQADALTAAGDNERVVLEAFARFRQEVDRLDDELLSAFEEAVRHARDRAAQS